MSLSEVDMKILWSRSAGLCAFPDCRELLVRFSKAADGMYQIGEMAHLVARSIKGPRGIGLLDESARDSYENHILLCPTCHTEIDKNPKDYTVEQLQAFKRQHEHWVAETLFANLDKKISFIGFYKNVLKRLETALQLDKWAWLIDNLWRDLAPSDLLESIDVPRSIMLRTSWPGNKPRLEEALKAVLQSWSDYCENFEQDCRYSRNPDFLVSSHCYPGMSVQEQLLAEEEQAKWSKRNSEILFKYVISLNRLVDVVREEILPTYRQEEGYFLIFDSLGYRNGGEPVIIRPYAKREVSG